MNPVCVIYIFTEIWSNYFWPVPSIELSPSPSAPSEAISCRATLQHAYHTFKEFSLMDSCLGCYLGWLLG